MRRRTALVRAAEAGGDPHDRVYLGYGVVLLALVYGPILWSAVAVAGGVLPVGAFAGSLLGLGLASAGTALAARTGGPLWVSPAEATFVLGGQFRPRTVLRLRGASLVAGAAVLGAFMTTALASAGGGPALLGWGLAGALGAQVPLAVGVAAQTPRWRRTAHGVAGALLVLGGACLLLPSAVLARPGALGAPGSLGGLVPLGVVAAVGVACVLLVLRVLPDEVDADEAAAGFRRTAIAGSGLAGGDSGGTAELLGARRSGGRGSTFVAPLLRRAPVVARDLLGLRRLVNASLASVLVGGLGGLMVLSGADGGAGDAGGGGGALPVVIGAAALYASSAGWAGGLRAFASQPEPGRLLPGPPGRLLAAHLVIPAAVAAGVGGLALGVGAVLGLSGPVAGPVLVALLVVVLAARAWVAGASAAPPEIFTPMMTPAGDMAMLVLAAWYLRGWLVVVTVAWLAQRAGPGAGVTTAVLAVAVAVWLVRAAVRRVARA